MKETILSVAGKPGLFRLITRGRAMLIIESIDDAKKRIPVGTRDRVTSLNDVSMYSDAGDKPLMEILQTIADQHESKPVSLDFKKASSAELADFMAAAVPDYDRDRVHDSDIRKLIQWYNILVRGGYTQFVETQGEA